MQFTPDWTQQWSAETFTRELKLEFRGPGLYLDDTDTILVIPAPPNDSPTPDTIWKKEQPEGTLYDIYVWNFGNLAISYLAAAPVRSDGERLERGQGIEECAAHLTAPIPEQQEPRITRKVNNG